MFKGLFDAGYKELKRVEKIALKIDALAPEYKKLTDDELKAKTPELGSESKLGLEPNSLLPHRSLLVLVESTTSTLMSRP